MPQFSGRDDFYKGTADSVRHNLYLLRQVQADHVLVFPPTTSTGWITACSSDFHVEQDADASIAVLEVPVAEASRFGVMAVDDQWRITGFEEKPEIPCPIPGQSGRGTGLHGYLHVQAEIPLRHPARRARRGFRQTHHSPRHPPREGLRLSVFQQCHPRLPLAQHARRQPRPHACGQYQRCRITGKTSAISTPTGSPTWTSRAYARTSASTANSGRCARSSSSFRR